MSSAEAFDVSNAVHTACAHAENGAEPLYKLKHLQRAHAPLAASRRDGMCATPSRSSCSSPRPPRLRPAAMTRRFKEEHPFGECGAVLSARDGWGGLGASACLQAPLTCSGEHQSAARAAKGGLAAPSRQFWLGLSPTAVFRPHRAGPRPVQRCGLPPRRPQAPGSVPSGLSCWSRPDQRSRPLSASARRWAGSPGAAETSGRAAEARQAAAPAAAPGSPAPRARSPLVLRLRLLPSCPDSHSSSHCPAAEKRAAEAARIRDKYPDRIPVRVDRSSVGVGFCCMPGRMLTPTLSPTSTTGHCGARRQDQHPGHRQEEVRGLQGQ